MPLTTVTVFKSTVVNDPEAPVFCVAIVPRPKLVRAPAAVLAPGPP